MTKKYRIFTDTSIITAGHVGILIPFLGIGDSDMSDPDFGRFNRYQKLGTEFLELTADPATADIFVWPKKWSGNSAELLSFLSLAKSYGKHSLVFFNDDSDENLGIHSDDVTVFRTSFYRSTKAPNETALPGWSIDSGSFAQREKGNDPIVGFCGCYTNNMQRYLSLKSLDQDERIKTNFILHDHAWGAKNLSDVSNIDNDYRQTVREAFMNNMLESDYILCARGQGNYSYRIYETLSAGRIPVIIDTDVVLPHDEILNWKDISIWVPQDQVEQASDFVYSFHNNISSKEFIDLQAKCRMVYEDYIRPTEFYKTWFNENMRGNNHD